MKYIVIDRNNDQLILDFDKPDELAVWLWGKQLDHYEFYKRISVKKLKNKLKIEYKRVLITSCNFEIACRELSYA